jgi:60 kDa SS-A/Ro ribonucleoprotein
MTQNYAGAYAFKADKWTRLNRFLTIGSQGGTYHAGDRQVTLDNLQAVQECIDEDGVRVVREVVEISDKGRAPKNDQAVMALAYCIKKGDLATRREAELAVNKVCRIGTHISQFAEAVDTFGYDPKNNGKGTGGGWGPIVMRSMANWYNSRTPDQVAYQAVKYQQREGWSHKDLIRLSHVTRHSDSKSLTGGNSAVYGWILDRNERVKFNGDKPRILEGFERIQGVTDPKVAAGLIRDYRLPREVVPTQLLNSTEVWEALLEQMPMTALIRNLGKMSSIGLLGPLSEWTGSVSSQLTDREALRKARVHPINLIVALRTYSLGHGIKGDLEWSVNQQIINALDDAFYASFENLEPINKRVLIAIDKSGSMRSSASATVLSAMECAAIMAMATVRKSNNYHIVGYDAENQGWGGGDRSGLVELNINPHQRLDDIVKNLPHDGGGTDASLPARWARKNKIKVDAICLYSDGESWKGHTHASQEMDNYRRYVGSRVAFCTCDTVANATMLTDNLDGDAFHCAGFDEQAPSLIQNFINSH